MPDPEKLHQVAALTALGRSTREIEPIAGIDHTTVSRWIKSNDAQQLINLYRPAIAARLSQRMWQMADNETLELSPQQLAVIWGISMDKHDKATSPSQDGIKITINIDNRELHLGNQET